MAQLLHTGDTHIGYEQYHSPERRADFLRAFEQVVDDAIELDVDAVVHAGDLFHNRRPDLPDLQGTIQTLRRLRQAGIPFLAIVGNHEEKRGQQWLDLFAELDLAERLDATPRVVGDIALYGLDYTPPATRDELTYEFDPHDASHAALVAHGLFDPFSGADWDTEAVLSAATVSFDAMLLGDNHDPGTAELDGTWVTYPGSTERTSASEREHRGYNLVSTTTDELRIERRQLDSRRFVFIDVTLDPTDGPEVIHERIREHDHTDAVTIITLDGEGDSIPPGPLEERALTAGALVARVNDRREIETTDTDHEVTFADPDEAVRDRIRERDLSAPVRDIDRLIRDHDIATGNLRERVYDRVAEAMEADDEAPATAEETADAASTADAADPTPSRPADETGQASVTDFLDNA